MRPFWRSNRYLSESPLIVVGSGPPTDWKTTTFLRVIVPSRDQSMGGTNPLSQGIIEGNELFNFGFEGKKCWGYPATRYLG